MYWIYLTLFVLVILTPKLIGTSFWLFQEDDLEALLIFLLGALGFFIYIAKEKALLRLFKEKLLLQKQTNIISRDLSDSYSYIGEMNRKFDIVKDLAFRLPKEVLEVLGEGKKHTYQSILDAASMLSKTDEVSLRFVNVKEKKMLKVVETEAKMFQGFDAEALLREKKHFWVTDMVTCVCSPREAGGVLAFLLFAKRGNHDEDIELFQILASEALLLYGLDQKARKEGK
ncbi:MAG: hypothetical protein A2808_00895 [Candidatus Moranbacteria bacterium RIFCSPHIGHO2_01_FULL_55_24]|nr:MAG: hypothetical protein A2808_00895 [Candidatus Moranbacteria bacterium RIFCSPHIGHO2_01_FULL_55_24]